ncbi:hypothetical protein [Mycobacterium sp.]|uniref:hypothetical protein n=1 Tax=Mycobacterium sp. TaxID=1785 RepID=UPI0031CF61D3
MLLQPGQFLDDLIQLALGSVGRATLPNTTVKDFAALMLQTLQRTRHLLQNLRVNLGTVIQGLLINFDPSARVEHLIGIFTGGLGYPHD